MAMLAFAPGGGLAQTGKAGSKAFLLDITGAIGPATSEYFRNGVEEARRQDAQLLVLRLDTPGGLDSAMREIVKGILQSAVPVASYVSPSGARAASAGTYIVYASHLAAMTPGTHLGAATPVQLGGGFAGSRKEKNGSAEEGRRKPFNASEAKAVNDAVAYIRGLAQLRGRNAEWAEKAVRTAETLTAAEAKSERVVEIIAADISDLLNQADGRTVEVEGQQVTLRTRDLSVTTIEPSLRTRILATITNPNVAYILLLIGIYGLLFEFISPGNVVPGVIGGIALLMGLYALNLMPVSYAGVGLLLLGIALMIAEALLPSFGVIGMGGIAAFAAGSLFLFRDDVPGFDLSWPVIAAVTIASAAFLVIAVAAIWRAQHRPVVTGDSVLLGSTGKVLWWVNGEGEILVGGERWAAKSTRQFGPGDHVRVAERRNLSLLVEPDPDTKPKT
jgi:membrane-bound serine protease (ClpP class)